jgi:hypothetical protein
MKRASVAGVFALCLGLTVACGGNSNEGEIAEREPEVQGEGDARPVPTTQTGCLTAQGDRFVLTALQSGAAGTGARPEGEANRTPGTKPATGDHATTESYQLIGNEDELRKHVGQQVRVSGEMDPPKVAEVRESTPPTSGSQPAGTSGQAEPAKPGEPQVSATTETRLEVTQLRVQSVTPTGERCEAAPNR